MDQSRGSKPFTCCCKKPKPKPTCKKLSGKDCSRDKKCGKGGKCAKFPSFDLCRNKHLREMMEKRYPNRQCIEIDIYRCCCKNDLSCRSWA